MGLFDLFKKKTTATINFAETINVPQYNAWENKQQPRNDDYAIAAFIAISKNGAKIGKTNDDYPRYINYEFKVNDPIKYHKNVIAEGYLVEAEPCLALKSFKVDQLKAILAQNGLPEKGKKEELIARISESVDLSSLNLETYYVPSEKGYEHLKKYEYVFDLKKYAISWEEFDDYKKQNEALTSTNDLIWGILQSRYYEYMKESLYGLMRNECHYMAMFLENEQRYKDAVKQYIKVLYYDTSGCGNTNYIEKVDEITLAPSIIKEIFDLKEYFEEGMLDRVDDLPHHYINKRDFKRLLYDIFEDKTIDINNYVK